VDITGHKYWLVLRNNESSTDSYWEDGSSSTYRRWAAGEPDADTDNICVHYDVGGLFHDDKCTDDERYTCKTAAQPQRKLRICPVAVALRTCTYASYSSYGRTPYATPPTLVQSCDRMSSVRLSVTLVDCDHIVWKSWKIIAKKRSTCCQGNMAKFWGD